MSATISIQKLRCVGDLPSPSLPTAELAGSRRLPENSRQTTSRGTKEKPLAAAEVARARDQGYLLYELANRYPKPSVVRVGHIGGDYAAREVTPGDTPRADVRSKLDQAPSR